MEVGGRTGGPGLLSLAWLAWLARKGLKRPRPGREKAAAGKAEPWAASRGRMSALMVLAGPAPPGPPGGLLLYFAAKHLM